MSFQHKIQSITYEYDDLFLRITFRSNSLVKMLTSMNKGFTQLTNTGHNYANSVYRRDSCIRSLDLYFTFIDRNSFDVKQNNSFIVGTCFGFISFI